MSDADVIVVAGRRVRLSDRGVRVVLWDHPEGLSFTNKGPGGTPLYAERRNARSQPIAPSDLQAIIDTMSMVVLHTDLTSTSAACHDVLVQRGLSTHFMIDWDGTIYQGMDLAYQSFHGGSVNSHSIGIDLNNPMRNLVRDPDAPAYPAGHPALATRNGSTWPHHRPRSPVARINHGRVQSYGYTEPQYRALNALLATLTREDLFYRIRRTYPMDAQGEVIKTVVDGGEGFEGVVAHWHVSANRWDPGPSFDWERMRSALVAETNSFPLVFGDAQTIANLGHRPKILQLAERFHALNERGESDQDGPVQPDGGWFPLSPNGTWHGGVHLQAPAATDVLAMVEGKLVAARMNPCPTALGSNNFVLLRHEVPLPFSRDRRVPRPPLVFYSLYMHLAYVDPLDAANQKRFPWLAALKGGGDAPAFDDACRQTRPRRHGPGLAFLKEGSVATFPHGDGAIVVGASEPLAPVGRFDGSGQDGIQQVHVEVFADDSWMKALDLANHSDAFTLLRATPGNRSLIANEQLRTSVGDVRELYDGGRPADKALQRRLRKLVVRHVSEWSDQVDWVQALSQAQNWKGKLDDFDKALRRGGALKGALERALPFIWLDAEVAQAVGLKSGPTWTGHLWHFHPIHFVTWLTLRASGRPRKASKGVSKEKLKRLRRRELEAHDAEGGAHGSRDLGIGAALDDEELGDLDLGSMLDDYLEGSDVGEWRETRQP